MRKEIIFEQRGSHEIKCQTYRPYLGELLPRVMKNELYIAFLVEKDLLKHIARMRVGDKKHRTNDLLSSMLNLYQQLTSEQNEDISLYNIAEWCLVWGIPYQIEDKQHIVKFTDTFEDYDMYGFKYDVLLNDLKLLYCAYIDWKAEYQGFDENKEWHKKVSALESLRIYFYLDENRAYIEPERKDDKIVLSIRSNNLIGVAYYQLLLMCTNGDESHMGICEQCGNIIEKIHRNKRLCKKCLDSRGTRFIREKRAKMRTEEDRKNEQKINT